MAYSYNSGDSAVTYPQLIIGQIKILQNICAKELKDGEKIIKNLIGEQTIEGEDSRYSFLQSVDFLGSLLSPWFGKGEATGKYESFEKLYHIELKDALKDKDFKKEAAFYFDMKEEEFMNKIKSDGELQNSCNLFLLNKKIKNGQIMFRELIKVFKENDFLAQETYGEGASGGGDEQTLDAQDEDEPDVAEDTEEEGE